MTDVFEGVDFFVDEWLNDDPYPYFEYLRQTLGPVWIDQRYFCWYPNLYVVLVAPPGIVSKSTTAEVGMDLLRQVPNIHFGPSVVTWQSLVKSFAEAGEGFLVKGANHVMSPLTISSSEFGNLLNPKDKDMVDMLVNLWDGKSFVKATKMSGTDEVINPWINIIAATTPDWIAGSFPEYMVGGGFTSRCLFCYADEKAHYVPYPALITPPNIEGQKADLIHDLEHIAVNICGEYQLTPEAIEWGSSWYRRHYESESKALDPSRFGGYVSRKQTQAHKVAMVLAASRRDGLSIEREDLETAVSMLTDLEPDMHRVFDKIGMTQEAIHSDRLSQLIAKRQRMSYADVYGWMKQYFHGKSAIEDVIAAGVAAGHYHVEGNGPFYVVAGPVTTQQRATVVPISKGSS